MPLSRILEHPAVGFAWILAVLVSLGIHEFAHALAADRLGDSTARDAGRLTLNPLAHLDPVGALMLVLVGFGWGNPVPFDATRLRLRRWGPALVALAGPFANAVGIVLAAASIHVLDRFTVLPANNLLVYFLIAVLQTNAFLLLFNCIPIPPLDGSKLLLGILDHPRYDDIRAFLEVRGPILLIALVVVDGISGGAAFGWLLSAAAGRIFSLVGL